MIDTILHPRTIILLSYGLLLLLLSLRSMRGQRLKERYVLLFCATGLPFLVLALWPDGVVWLSETLTIEKNTVMTLGLAAFLILIIMELFSLVSVQERKIATLAQMVGILMEQQEKAQREIRGNDENVEVQDNTQPQASDFK